MTINSKNEKETLIEDSEENFKLLLAILESVPTRKRNESIETDERDKNFRDVFMHLYEWHAMLERWYREGMDGDMPSMPAPGYKWRNLRQLNEKIHESYQDITINQALKKLILSHRRVMKLIQVHTNEEIITKKYFKWTKTSNLYSYFVANTSNHYLWAIKRCEVIAKTIIEK